MTARKRAKAGTIPFVREGNRIKFDPAVLAAYLVSELANSVRRNCVRVSNTAARGCPLDPLIAARFYPAEKATVRADRPLVVRIVCKECGSCAGSFLWAEMIPLPRNFKRPTDLIED